MKSFRLLVADVARGLLLPFVPARQKLPFMYWLHRIDGSCEAELVHLHRFSGSTGVALDIGANLGWYTYSLSKRFKSVYAFEINDETTEWIKRYNPGNIEIVHCGLSSASRNGTLYIPVIRGYSMSGWGSLHCDNFSETSERRQKAVKVARLDEFEINNVGFIKIDVEGHEVEVLKGATATIAESRPIVLIEIRDPNLQTVDLYFFRLKYRRYRLEDFLEVKGHRENYIYVPQERLGEVGVNSDDNSAIAH